METRVSCSLPVRYVPLSLQTSCPPSYLHYPVTGKAQPSMVFRYLRSLEGVSPPLALQHHSCQLTAKAWVSTCTFPSFIASFLVSHSRITISQRPVFDRMFSLGLSRENPPVDPRVPNANGPRRHFLYCSLKPVEIAPRRSVLGSLPV